MHNHVEEKTYNEGINEEEVLPENISGIEPGYSGQASVKVRCLVCALSKNIPKNG